MPPSSQSPRDSPARRQRRRRTHHRTDSNGELLQPDRRPRERVYESDEEDLGEGLQGSPSKRRRKREYRDDRRERDPRAERDVRTRAGHGEGERRRRAPESQRSETTSTALSSEQLAALDDLNRKMGWDEYDDVHRPLARERQEETQARYDEGREREREERELARERRHVERREKRRREKEELRRGEVEEAGLVYENPKFTRRKEQGNDRVVSGQRLERGMRGGGGSEYYSEKEEYRDDVRRYEGSSTDPGSEGGTPWWKRRRNIFIGVGLLVLVLIIVIPVAVVVSKKSSSSNSGIGGAAASNSSAPSNSNLKGISEDDIPQQYQGTYLDPFTWYDTDDFNVTFTSTMIGNLSIMGVNDTWDDNTQANANVKALNQTWNYGTDLIHGVNLGGWLSIEPFITPSFFSSYSTHDNVVDEYTLSATLGPSKAKSTIEQHYSSFVSEQTFADIQAAGFDHVRIPFSYWAVTTYDGDPYVPNVSWRYLLRAIEWARKHGLRVNLDLHGAPGSQNGWNHSGRQGDIGWLNGDNGDLNGQRTLSIHDQLSTFFSQPRYKNVVTMYGLVNEPRMTSLDVQTVLDWSQSAITTIRNNNYTGIIIFGDGFRGLDNWQGELQGIDNLLLDVHQYVIFNVDQIVLNHHDKINFACGGWTAQAKRSSNPATGFGPTLCGEWSQADTDCATSLNNVGIGSRWEGTLNMANGPGGSSNGSVLNPTCPTANNPRCSCDDANADPASYSAEYKAWLLMFAEAQMHSFEQGWGWFYWTWQTESAAQWSYKAGLAAGVLPALAYQRDFDCSQDIPDYAGLGLAEYY